MPLLPLSWTLTSPEPGGTRFKRDSRALRGQTDLWGGFAAPPPCGRPCFLTYNVYLWSCAYHCLIMTSQDQHGFVQILRDSFMKQPFFFLVICLNIFFNNLKILLSFSFHTSFPFSFCLLFTNIGSHFVFYNMFIYCCLCIIIVWLGKKQAFIGLTTKTCIGGERRGGNHSQINFELTITFVSYYPM